MLKMFRATMVTSILLCKILVILMILSGSDSSLPGVKENEDKTSGTLSFTPPELDDEDAHSLHMPASLKCDGCRIIAYQLVTQFLKSHGRRPPASRLTESEILDAVETVCEGNFEDYGIKAVDGGKRLSGPGLETKDVPGVMQGGGKWPMRLRDMCSNYAGEIGEEEIYNAFKENQQLEDFLCKGEGLQGECNKGETEKKTEL